MAGVAGARLGDVCTGDLAGTSWFLVRTVTGSNASEGIEVRSVPSEPPLGTETKGCLATPNPVGWWSGR